MAAEQSCVHTGQQPALFRSNAIDFEEQDSASDSAHSHESTIVSAGDARSAVDCDQPRIYNYHSDRFYFQSIQHHHHTHWTDEINVEERHVHIHVHHHHHHGSRKRGNDSSCNETVFKLSADENDVKSQTKACKIDPEQGGCDKKQGISDDL